MYSHTCLKCHKPYQDDDVEAYYCSACKAEMQAVATEFDRKRENSVKKESVGELDTFLQDPRTVVKNGGNSIFIRESQL